MIVGELEGLTNDEHPHADIRAGESFLSHIYQAVTSSRQWPNTILIITYDEWGGFFDHVPPPPGSVTAAEQTLGYTDGLRGFRIPALLVSPMARRGQVSHTVFDHTSVLKLIEWRWSLDPLTERDANANNLAKVLNFKTHDQSAPQYNVPDLLAGEPCGRAPTIAAEGNGWAAVQAMAQRYGWPTSS